MANKSKEDLKKELSSESYYVTQENGTERHLLENFGIILKVGHTHAYVVEKHYFNLILNLMQAAVGQVFIKPLTVKILKS